MLNDVLKKVYEYDDSDLDSNRMEQVSEKQRKGFQERAMMTRKVLNGAAIALLVLALLLPCILVPVGLLVIVLSQDWKVLLETWGTSFIWFLAWGGLGAVSWWFGHPKEAIRPTITSTRGPVTKQSRTLQTDHGRSYKIYSLTCGDLTFDIDDDLAPHVHDGDELAVYYLKFDNGASPQILSVECLSQASH